MLPSCWVTLLLLGLLVLVKGHIPEGVGNEAPHVEAKKKLPSEGCGCDRKHRGILTRVASPDDLTKGCKVFGVLECNKFQLFKGQEEVASYDVTALQTPILFATESDLCVMLREVGKHPEILCAANRTCRDEWWKALSQRILCQHRGEMREEIAGEPPVEEEEELVAEGVVDEPERGGIDIKLEGIHGRPSTAFQRNILLHRKIQRCPRSQWVAKMIFFSIYRRTALPSDPTDLSARKIKSQVAEADTMKLTIVPDEEEEWVPGLEEFLSEDEDWTPEQLQKKLESLEPLVSLSKKFENVVIVGGLPITSSKKEGLSKVLALRASKELAKKRVDFNPETLQILVNEDEETGMAGGCAILTFESSFEAKHAAEGLNGSPLDKKHTMTACVIDEFDKIISRSDDGVVEGDASFGFSRKGLRWWMEHETGNEQFAVRYKDETEIYWHDPVGLDPIFVDNGASNRAEGKTVWTKGNICWSPLGSYFCTFHKPGIVFWGRENFERVARIMHKETKTISFSPNEDFVLTYDGSSHGSANEKAVQIWRVISQESVRSFKTPAATPSGTKEGPPMVWSHDSAFLAGGVAGDPGTIAIYKTPDMTKVCDFTFEMPRPVAVAPSQKIQTWNARDPRSQDQGLTNLLFEWSPASNVLSVFIPEKSDSPARVVLYAIPSKTELASASLFNVKSASIHWQSRGYYMAMLTALQRKTGKKSRKDVAQIQIFRLKEKAVPIDVIQIDNYRVRNFVWETAGHRCAVLVQDENTHSQSIRFYAVSHSGGSKKETALCCTWDVTSYINFFAWSPLGSNFIAAATGGSGEGTLLFGALTEQNKVDTYHRDEHFQVNHISWDSSGRYIATAVCLPMTSTEMSWKIGKDAGYQIWSFQGRLHCNFKKEEFYIFQWRPRPASLLTPAREREVFRQLKEYSKRYDEIDTNLRKQKRDEFLAGRNKLINAFMAHVNAANEWYRGHELYDEWQASQKRLEVTFQFEEQRTKTEEVVEVRTELVG